jgi:hypothetical protein
MSKLASYQTQWEPLRSEYAETGNEEDTLRSRQIQLLIDRAAIDAATLSSALTDMQHQRQVTLLNRISPSYGAWDRRQWNSRMNLVYPVFGLLDSALRGMSTRWYGYGYAMVRLRVCDGTGCVYESAVAWSRRSITQGLKMDSSSTSLQSAVYAMHGITHLVPVFSLQYMR